MRILIIDDEESIRRTTSIALKTMGHESMEAGDGKTALDLLTRYGFHIVFLDLKLAGGESGLHLLPRLLNGAPNLHVVVFTAHASIETAVQAIQHGAADYVEKPFTPDQIRLILGKIEKTRKLQHRIDELEDRLFSRELDDIDFTSKSPLMQRVYATAQKAAASDASILLLGESGTGKTFLANEVHNLSPRSKAKFVTISCPSLTKELLASELFGHIRGSFTGALKDSWGKVAFADGGTLFLDEIGDVPLDIQPKLLRLLQERQYERVGETTTRHADVRVIAASNQPLSKAMSEGAFREDLYYRLNVITLQMPALRDRREDLERLVQGFIGVFARQNRKNIRGFTEEAWQWIREYRWPGNIRELRNFVERAVILAEGELLDMEGLLSQAPAESGEDPNSSIQVGSSVTLEDLSAEHIRKVIETSETMEQAAKILGIDSSTLYRKRKKLETPQV